MHTCRYCGDETDSPLVGCHRCQELFDLLLVNVPVLNDNGLRHVLAIGGQRLLVLVHDTAVEQRELGPAPAAPQAQG